MVAFWIREIPERLVNYYNLARSVLELFFFETCSEVLVRQSFRDASPKSSKLLHSRTLTLMTYPSLKLRVSSMKIDGWRQDPFGGGHFLFKYKLIVSGKLLLAKLTFGDMFAHFSACPWVFSYSTRGRFMQLTRDSTPQRLSWGRWWEFVLVLPFCRSWEVTCQVKHHITSLTLTQSFLKRTSSKDGKDRAHTHKPHLRTTSSAHLTCAFHILTIRFVANQKEYNIHQYTQIDIYIYASNSEPNNKQKNNIYPWEVSLAVSKKQTPAKRLRLTFHNRIRTERFGECGARPWGSPMYGEGYQVGGWTFFLLEHSISIPALKFSRPGETFKAWGPFSRWEIPLTKTIIFWMATGWCTVDLHLGAVSRQRFEKNIHQIENPKCFPGRSDSTWYDERMNQYLWESSWNDFDDEHVMITNLIQFI